MPWFPCRPSSCWPLLVSSHHGLVRFYCAKLPFISRLHPSPCSPQLFSNAMGALPCELGPDGRTPVMQKQCQFRMFNPTPTMEAWARRAEATKQRKQQQEEGTQP